MSCSTKCCLIVWSVIGGLLAILGGILIPVGDTLINKEISKEAVIENGTIAYENWIETGSPVYRSFWIFHVTNPDQIINGGKPELQQKGPYTYLVRYIPKANVTQHQNSTVTFWQPNGAVFQRHLSIGSEEETHTVLNLAVAAAPAMFKPFQGILNNYIKKSNSSLFQVRSVKEILWGYTDPFLQQIPLPSLDKTTGVFYPNNGTADGPYNVYNGKDDISKVAIIDKYKEKSSLSYWSDSYCDMINGTDAASFPPHVKNNKRLYFFSSEICRSIYGLFKNEYELKGIKLYRFVVPKESLDSPDKNPDNHCYCTDESISRNCTAAGVLDLSKCQGGKPVYLSLPHFLHASEFILKSVNGLSPNEEEHQTFIDVEPITGFTMHFAKRLQINIMFTRSNKIEIMSKLQTDFVFPVVWLNETALIDDERAKMFKSSILFPMKVLEIVQIVLITFGSVVFLACSITLCVRSSRK
ncbi:hypothetical protein GDO86_005955 [Hymenochirus boettgeri]|uniref:Platelet glycoprotein 4 n=1 Tax=Hymenochirus boettgeri TaxID=247094 RepID=A0A8T2J9K2_9PIPI|nr:hypothetical protein GDO86_005955 [Hymenochirus boettgeri]